tara:strand:+ start:163 stop:852 length:690 start_codon:yes stop_codon:yes gene_type:complete
MGIFSSTKFTDKQIQLINNYLPEDLKVSNFKMNEVEHLISKINTYILELNSELNKKAILLLKLKEENLSNSYMIYNVPINGKSLGLVDVGLVSRFNAKSTGNSFENGVIQYAIETSSEKVWADNNSQYNSVQEIKSQLKIKSISLFPKSNAIENFNITFRELGSSGNVFIYASGTASIPESNKELKENEEIQLIIEEIKKLNKKIETSKIKFKELPDYLEIKEELKNLK